MGKVQPSISKFFQPKKSSEKEGSSPLSNISIDLTEEYISDVTRESPMKRKRSDLEQNGNEQGGSIIRKAREKLMSEYGAKPPSEISSGSNKKLKSIGSSTVAKQQESPVSSNESPETNEPDLLEIEDVESYVDRATPEASSPPQPHVRSKRTKAAKTKPANASSAAIVSKLTPLEKQVYEFKMENTDKILAIQVGYKFKFFGPDAVIVARILNIMLVPGKIRLDQPDSQYDRIAYCSIPDNRLHIHLQRILSHGHKVGVIKQTETAAVKSVDGNKNSLFERKITAIYTKATYMDDELLAIGNIEGSNSSLSSSERGKYIFCIDESSPDTLSFVAVSPATGEIVYETFQDDNSKSELETRLSYLSPSEILVVSNDGELTKEVSKVLKVTSQSSNSKITSLKRRESYKIANELTEFFKENLKLTEYYTTNFDQNVQSCIIELIDYLKEFKLSNIFTINSSEYCNIQKFSDTKRYMLLPSNTLQSLEIFENSSHSSDRQRGSLVWILNHTRTKSGERLLSKWISKPLIEKSAIEERLDAVEHLKSDFSHFVETFLKQLSKSGGLDFDKSLTKVHYASSYRMDKISRKEIYLFLKSMSDFLQLTNSFENEIKSWKSPLLCRIFQDLLDAYHSNKIPELLNMINASVAIEETDLAKQKTSFFKHKWDEVERVTTEIEEIEDLLSIELMNVRKILKRPQLNFVTNMKESHLIEVRNGNMVKSLPLNWIKINSTKSVSRFRTPEISKLLSRLKYKNDMLVEACDIAYNRFLSQIDDSYDYFAKIVRGISEFDCLASLTAASSANIDYAKPIFVDEVKIDVKQGRNPIIESLSTTSNYIPNDISMSYDDDRCLVITGPNMGGKSSYVRQVALIVLMAQIGCYVPCESATLGVFDSIFTRMGAQDNIIKGESTFMVEMMECSNIIKNCTPKSLVLLDEIGRGTGTTDGISIAYAILDYFIKNCGCLTLFITHYPSLHEFESMYHKLVKNYHMGFVEVENPNQEWPDILFLYTLARGVVTNSYGINVAKLAGIPKEIVSEAYRKSNELREEIERKEDMEFGIQLAYILKSLSNENSEDTFDKLKRLSLSL
ncbi:DNA mismatch repair protein Msh3p [[Candida] railenensis]|uniref:DNA mismatch repair protein MSH3 n=1 Tax=[Candida] railenensis TaxID=45579 RepID=A0A9P0VWC9_9ASCO|nr:DNA mismatch repair protein Msh3p [[Candida] railenensis]